MGNTMQDMFYCSICNTVEFTFTENNTGLYYNDTINIGPCFKNDLLFNVAVELASSTIERNCYWVDKLNVHDDSVKYELTHLSRPRVIVTSADKTEENYEKAMKFHNECLEFDTLCEHKPHFGIFKPKSRTFAKTTNEHTDEQLSYLLTKGLTIGEIVSNFGTYWK